MKKIALTLCFLLIVTFGFSQTLVSYNKTEGVDFSKYKTYKIDSLEIKKIPEFEPQKAGLNLLMLEIIKQMNARGYEKVSENPDLLINIGLVLEEGVQTRETSIRDAPYYIGQRNYHWESEEVVVGKYTEGTVTLDLIDSDKNAMIWQAVSSGVLSKKREKNKKRIVKGVNKLFKKFPVKKIED